jgi:hypothetical protein
VFAGFFPDWAASMGTPIKSMAEKKARRYEQLAACPEETWLSVETPFASIPEISDLFTNIFSAKPRWIRPFYDMAATPPTIHSSWSQGLYPKLRATR